MVVRVVFIDKFILKGIIAMDHLIQLQRFLFPLDCGETFICTPVRYVLIEIHLFLLHFFELGPPLKYNNMLFILHCLFSVCMKVLPVIYVLIRPSPTFTLESQRFVLHILANTFIYVNIVGNFYTVSHCCIALRECQANSFYYDRHCLTVLLLNVVIRHTIT